MKSVSPCLEPNILLSKTSKCREPHSLSATVSFLFMSAEIILQAWCFCQWCFCCETKSIRKSEIKIDIFIPPNIRVHDRSPANVPSLSQHSLESLQGIPLQVDMYLSWMYSTPVSVLSTYPRFCFEPVKFDWLSLKLNLVTQLTFCLPFLSNFKPWTRIISLFLFKVTK